MKRGFAVATLGILLSGLMLLTGCGGGSTTPPPVKTLVSITMTPPNPSIVAGTTEAFTATGNYSDGTSQNLTASAVWSSSATTVATVSNSAGTQGVATGVIAGSTTITATSGAVSGSTTLTVTIIAPTLTSIAVAPPNPLIFVGATQAFTATGTYSDGSTQNITTSVTWSSSATSVATISNQGSALGVAAGSTTITATLGTINGSTTLTVQAVTLTSIAVTPVNPSISVGGTKAFTATGSYNDGSSQNITTSVTWSSSTTSVATISSQGVATGAGVGSSTIKATSGTVNGSTTLTVTAVTLTSIAVTPSNPSIPVGNTQAFTATGTYSDSSTQTITTTVTWSSSDATVASISNTAGSQGVATGLKAGGTTITAMLSGKTGTASLSVTALASQPGWTQDGPLARNSHSGVFDPNTGQMIIFGGQDTATGAALNDLWLVGTAVDRHLSASSLTSTASGPSARYGHTATYDSASNRMTIFGGGSSATACTKDVWVLDGANGQSGSPTWIQLTPSGGPTARMHHDAVYDSTSNSLIIFGGSDCSGGFNNDVWALSHANGQGGTPVWTQVSTAGPPPAPREGSSTIYDSVNNILTIYGGDSGPFYFQEIWTLSNANGSGGAGVWAQLTPTGTLPTASSGHSAIYDTADNIMIVFGGVNGSTTFGDTWTLTSPNGIGGTPAWKKLAPTGTKPTLYFHSAAYDDAANAMYLFGGTSTTAKLEVSNHTFVLSEANGLSTTPAWTLSGPPVRYSQSAFYDSATNDLFVFGGQHATNDINFNDFWKNTGAIGSTALNWTNVATSATKPVARYGQAAQYDSGSNRMMVFGGATGFPAPCQNDTWILQNANTSGGTTPTWVSVSPTGPAPAARMRHSSAYDSATNSLIVFGGYDCTSTYFNDVWVLSDANDVTGTPAWTQLVPTGPPPSVREGSSLVYDAATNTLVVFGGDKDFTNGSAPLGDIWVLSHANGSGGTPAWKQLTPSGGPSARTGHTAIYDAANNLMTVYGGFDGTNVLSDTWILSAANGQSGTPQWSQLAPTPAGPPRRFHSAMYDATSNQMLVFGGVSAMSPLAPDANTFFLTVANGLP